MKLLNFYTLSIRRTVLIGVVLCLWNNLSAQNLVSDVVERNALIALQVSTDSAHWVASKKWSATAVANYPNSTLAGVDIQNGDIVSINLDYFGLNGTLPSELNTLTEIQYVSMRENNLTGTLVNLSSLQKVVTLDFYYNNFNGAFPTWICNMVNLETLNLSSNPNSANKLSGPIPAQIAQLTHLKTLYLNNNDFSAAGSIPSSFSSLDNLQTLELQYCSLTDSSITTGLSNLDRLYMLNLTGNSSINLPDGTFPDILFNLPMLETLYLGNINFQKLSGHFSQLSNLIYLGLNGNYYADTIRLARIIDTLSTCPQLKQLSLISCSIAGLPDNISSLQRVSELYLSNNNLNPSRCESIGEMPALNYLFIQNCNLQDLPQSLVNISTLQFLVASNNKLNPIPEHIKNIPSLKVLDLSQNGIDSIPEWFGTANMPSLESLTLNYNRISLPFPSNLQYLSNLSTLSISHNLLDGELPSFFSEFSNMNYLDLSYNTIDSIPDLSSWSNLQILYLNHNNLQGAIPKYFTSSLYPKYIVNLSYNYFDKADVGTTFNNSPATVYVDHNKLDFSEIIKLRPSSLFAYSYYPQDSVDIKRDVKSLMGGSLTLIAAIDSMTTPVSKFQWFKYIDGVHDSILFSPPSINAYHYTTVSVATDQGAKFYYKITNDSYPALTLISRPQTLTLTCDILPTLIDFSGTKYLCAVNFNPVVIYPNPYKTKSFLWNFGDATSSEDKSPLHAYDQGGTYNVSLKVQYSSGICVSDTTVTKSYAFIPSADDALLMDSTILVTSEVKQQVIAVSASTFSDAWPLQQQTSVTTPNAYQNGSNGVWRNDGSFVYDVPRFATADKPKLATDGTFTLQNFNWAYADMEAIPHWIKATTMTEYSPYSYELENKDVLGIYSSALYDYGGHLPSANGSNMRNNEMAFTGFEYLDHNASGNWLFGSQSLPAYSTFTVSAASKYMAVVDAGLDELSQVDKVDVMARGFLYSIFQHFGRTNFLQDDDIVCRRAYPNDAKKSILILRKYPFDGIWTGRIKVKNLVAPSAAVNIDSTVAHTGKSSLKITSSSAFRQNLLQPDSGKVYYLSAWVSTNTLYPSSPKLADNLGIEIRFMDKNNTTRSSSLMEPVGPIIEGWQQLRGSINCPDKNLMVELNFQPGTAPVAWFDDLRFHPEEGNMKSYVYNLDDYRLQAILDEENFASFFYYDAEGNLFLTQKETEEGIKTISENISHMANTN